MSNPKFTIFKGANGLFYFRLRAANGEIILTSESYSSKSGCKNGIESVKQNAGNDDRYWRKDTPGNYTFVLRAVNDESIGKSENYSSSHGRELGISVVKSCAPIAAIEELVDRVSLSSSRNH